MVGRRVASKATLADKTHFNSTGPDVGADNVMATRVGESATFNDSFTSGPETVTFPVKVYSLVRRGVSPEINAASTVLIVITVVATVIAMKLQAPAKSGKG